MPEGQREGETFDQYLDRITKEMRAAALTPGARRRGVDEDRPKEKRDRKPSRTGTFIATVMVLGVVIATASVVALREEQSAGFETSGFETYSPAPPVAPLRQQQRQLYATPVPYSEPARRAPAYVAPAPRPTSLLRLLAATGKGAAATGKPTADRCSPPMPGSPGEGCGCASRRKSESAPFWRL